MMTEEQKTEIVDQEAGMTENKDQSRSNLDAQEKQAVTSDLEELKKDLADQKDKYLRLVAEFDNYKKRNIKERIELIRNASEELIQELIIVLDDFDRAKKISEEQQNEQIFPEGMRLVYHKLLGLLQSKGLEAMITEGKTFDPQFHEAITEIETPNPELKGKVFDTVEKGYLLNHKIIRFAKVVVAK
jgi:molecular chaperone GrpE